MIPKITMKELSFYQQQGAILIDVRDPIEYQKSHLNGAFNIPSARILEGLRGYPKDTLIILYCSTGKRSRTASQLLLSMGYTNVYDLGKVTLES